MPLVMGTVQGLTEFLPVSSSGHLAVLALLFGLKSHGLALETAMHVGTLGAVLVIYREDIRMFLSPPWPIGIRRDLAALSLATLPTALMGYLLEPLILRAFRDPILLAAGFATTTGILLLTRVMRPGRRETLSLPGALVIGACQGMAVFPGLSRSGTTIAAGLLLGLTPQGAARFSFLLSIPTILGAVFYSVMKEGLGPVAPGPLLVGVVAAAIAGSLSIRWVRFSLMQGRLWVFAAYTLAVAASLLVF